MNQKVTTMSNKMEVFSQEKCLNIGAGSTYIPGFINVDVSSVADISIDLNRDLLPIESESVDLVFTYHTIEHLDNYLFAISEIHRVMKHGARLFVGVPYVTLTEYNLVNPYHRQNFNEHSFDFFDPKELLRSAAEDTTVMFRKVFHRFHYLPEFESKSEKRKEWCRRHLFNVVKKIDFGLVAMKVDEPEINVDEAMPERFVAEFDELLRRRKKYPPQEHRRAALGDS